MRSLQNETANLLSAEQKDAVSHRGNALRSFAAALAEKIK